MSLTKTVYAAAADTVRQVQANERLARLVAFVTFAVIALAVIALQTYHFDRRNYRDDEIRTVHAGMTMTVPEVVQWMSVDIHPPLWRVSATIWVGLFGPDEKITRFETALYALLALAFMYRLAADLLDRRAALLAVFLLGTHSLFLFYAHEFRPYAALLLWIIALNWAFLRWLRYPRLLYAALYVLFCAAALYTHFFALYALAGQIATFLLLARWNPRLYLRAFGLWILAGLSFTGWLPSFLHSFLAAQPGGIEYGLPLNDPGTPGVLYNSLDFRPLALGNLLLGVALLTPLSARFKSQKPDQLFRFGLAWRKWYFIIMVAVIFAAAVLTELTITSVLTQRNLIIVLPAVAVLAAIGLRALPRQAVLIALVLLLNPSAREFIDYQRNQPYQEIYDVIAPDYQDHNPIIISVDQGTGSYFTFAYYLMDKMSGRITQADMFYLSAGEPDINLPEPPLNHIVDDSPESLSHFRALIGEAEQLWWISSEDAPPYIDMYRRTLEQDFHLAETHSFESYGRTYTVSAYRRIA
jgi:hypothetical protein